MENMENMDFEAMHDRQFDELMELLDAHRKTVLAHWLPEAKTDDA